MSALNKIKSYFKKSKYFIHETKKSVVIRFLLLFAIVAFYFFVVSMKYGIGQGVYMTLLTWSFFVFCTPIADAGFLLDFPVRLITKIRMIYSEICVWIVAFSLNFYSLMFNPGVYEKTLLLRVFRYILLHPFPYWAIIAISAVGTFFSVYFGDELIDVAKHAHRKKYHKHRKWHKLTIILFIILVAALIYKHLLTELGINIFI